MSKVGLVFPGQGSQAPGMGYEVFERLDAAKELLSRAEEILGFELGKIMFSGQPADLKPTEIAQPALFVCSAMYLERVKALGETVEVVAGHSLGEYSALYAAGVLSFKDGVRLTRKRGMAMSKSSGSSGGMAAILGMPVEKVEEALSPFEKVNVANENSRVQTVISGEREQLRKSCEMFQQVPGVKVVKLQVSDAFHTPYMANAREEMQREIARSAFHFPACWVIPNVTARPTKSIEEIKAALVDQITGRVRWMESFLQFKEMGIERVFEVGHGKVLKRLGMTITTKVKFSPLFSK